jgi:hypothetical protein
MATTPPVTGDPRNAVIASGKRAVQITANQVQPPSPLYLQAEDGLELAIFSPTIALPFIISVSVRWLRPDGEIVCVRRFFPCTLTTNLFLFTLGEGFLLDIEVHPTAAVTSDPGGIFTTVAIFRDQGDLSAPIWPLISDYITNTHTASWPYGEQILMQDTQGRIRSITGTAPAAGAEISETVPSNVRWLLKSASFTYAASVTVLNRQPGIIIDDGVNILYRYVAGQAVAASQTPRITASSSNQLGLQDGSGAILSIPDCLLLSAGFRWRTNTPNIQVGDQYSAPQYLVEEWVSV